MDTPPTRLLPRLTETTIEHRTIHRGGAFLLLLVFAASAIFTVSFLQSLNAGPHMANQTSSATAATVLEHRQTDAFASTTLEAHGAYVIDVTDRHILYSRNADAQFPLASITKVPLALAVSEVLSHDAHITIPYDTAPVGSSERLGQGDIWKVSDVIDFTLAASSNGGAQILADMADVPLHAKYPSSPLGGAALWRMNDLARELGLTKTYFLNVSGLDESATQAGAYGSARDVATLFAYAASTSPEIFAATTHPSFSLLSVNGARTIAINTDRVLDAIPGIIMGKTGYTDLAGGNLAVIFQPVPGHEVVAVVLGSTEQGRFEDMKKLVAATQSALRQ